MKNLKNYPEIEILVPTGYSVGTGEDWRYIPAVVAFKTTLLAPLPDGEYIVPSTLPEDHAEFEKWADRFRLCQAAMSGIRDCVFLEIVRVRGGIETWEYGT